MLCWRSMVSQISRSEEFFMLLRTPGLKSFKIPSIEKFRHRKKVSVSVNILDSSHSNIVWRLVLEVSNSLYLIRPVD